MVFEGELVAPDSGLSQLLVSQVFKHEISVNLDGRKAPAEEVGPTE